MAEFKTVALTACAGAWVLIAIILISVSLKRLSPVEYGVQYDRWTKTLDDAAKSGGLHIGPVGYRFIKFPSLQISLDLADTCVSRDGLRVAYSVTFQYSLQPDYITEVAEKYRDFKTWDVIVEAAATSAVQHSCSMYNITSFQQQRNQIQDTMFEKTRDKLLPIRAEANSLQLSNVDLPKLYTDAVSDKQRAEEDIALAINQRNQELTKAETGLKAAQEEATKITDNANNTAQITLTQARLKAEEITYTLTRQTEALKHAQDNLGLDSNGILAYMSNQLYENARSLKATIGEPAVMSRKSQLDQTGGR